MSWDRVIQDSDEDEPLGDDGLEAQVPASFDPPQVHEASKHQHPDNAGHHAAEQQAHYPIEQATTQEVGAEPDLGINFDQFLQSQHSSMTLSQRRREERWIPSTGDGGGGSIGALELRHSHSHDCWPFRPYAQVGINIVTHRSDDD
jgi:hypothetical protein